jgi:hypothetical protein
MMAAWRRLHRALFLRFPTLWVIRFHVVTVAGLLLSAGMLLIGQTIPIQEVSWGLDTGPFALAIVLSMATSALLTLYWAYLQVRDQRLVPFSGRSWLFPAYSYCILMLNAGPYLLSIGYGMAVRSKASTLPQLESYVDSSHYANYSAIESDLVALWLLLGLEVAVFLTAARCVKLRTLITTFAVCFALLVLIILSAEEIPALRDAPVTALAAFYVLAGLITVAPIRVPRKVLNLGLMIFLLYSPCIGVMVVEWTRRESFLPTDWLTIALGTIAAYTVLSLVLEPRIARLRATPVQ